MSKKDAKRILDMAYYGDYKVTKVYENGFKAIRTNEWCKTELYCEILTSDVNTIDEGNFYNLTSIAVMVVERYK